MRSASSWGTRAAARRDHLGLETEAPSPDGVHPTTRRLLQQECEERHQEGGAVPDAGRGARHRHPQVRPLLEPPEGGVVQGGQDRGPVHLLVGEDGPAAQGVGRVEIALVGGDAPAEVLQDLRDHAGEDGAGEGRAGAGRAHHARRQAQAGRGLAPESRLPEAATAASGEHHGVVGDALRALAHWQDLRPTPRRHSTTSGRPHGRDPKKHWETARGKTPCACGVPRDHRTSVQTGSGANDERLDARRRDAGIARRSRARRPDGACPARLPTDLGGGSRPDAARGAGGECARAGTGAGRLDADHPDRGGSCEREG